MQSLQIDEKQIQFVHADVPDVILFDWDNTLIDSWNTILMRH